MNAPAPILETDLLDRLRQDNPELEARIAAEYEVLWTASTTQARRESWDRWVALREQRSPDLVAQIMREHLSRTLAK